jgi:hypothetical protein
MTHRLVRNLIAGLALICPWGASPAWALDPGNYTVQCAPTDGASTEVASYNIRMDMVDLLTLRDSFGAIISGVRLDDGKRVILTGDRGCALIEADASRRTR